MSTPVTFKRAICRSAAEVKSKEDKIVLVLLALNYSREIEKEVSLGSSAVVDEYYDFLKDNLYSPVEDVAKPADIDFSTENVPAPSPVSKVVTKSLVAEITENPAPVTESIEQESVQKSTLEVQPESNKYGGLTEYDWNSALSNSSSPVQSKKESPVQQQKKVSPIPDAILYGDLSAYGIPNIERIKLVSQVGDLTDSNTHDHVYDLGLVPRTFKLGNRDAVQHVNNEVEAAPVVEAEVEAAPVVEAEVSE